ncbi:hypothetical protein G7046_g284 [Stylonectria norvegica]|nr:hypothetical protein G7046_g284 [Stylonectria norvegica]
MLLGLAGVFLHWSVTQPWNWYHSAQEVRIQNEASTETVFEDDSEVESPTSTQTQHVRLDHVPEHEEPKPAELDTKEETDEKRPTTQQQTALAELYVYETLALVSCCALPLVAAYLLHAIRNQLSRPSEGLVSNYNLTIFLLVSEMRVFSHMIKLVQSRTLHLQRIVRGNPYVSQVSNNTEHIEELVARLERLESQSIGLTAEGQTIRSDPVKIKPEAALTRDVRNAIQPELDALNRAVRRYEKKATLLQFQTESRFSAVEARLDDAIALAATAAKISASHKNVLVWTMESVVTLLLLPFKAFMGVVLLPLKTLLALVQRKKQKIPQSTKPLRSNRNGKAPLQPRYSGDRVPTRVSKR